MAAKITAFLITMLFNAAAGIAVFFGMLLAMNGFSESDAQYGIIAYIAAAIIVTIMMSSAAAFLVHFLLKRQFSGAVSAIIAIPVFSILGVGLKVGCSVIGVIIAEFVRVNY